MQEEVVRAERDQDVSVSVEEGCCLEDCVGILGMSQVLYYRCGNLSLNFVFYLA